MNKSLFSGLGLICLLGASSVVEARGVLYTVTTVTDGQLGATPFSQAVVTLRFLGDTRHVQVDTSSGHTIYTLTEGVATVSVNPGTVTTTASFAPGQIYVRYDVTAGVVSLGSGASSTYPIALDCSYASCSTGDWAVGFGTSDGTAGALADLAAAPADSALVSPATAQLPANLSQNTLLTGYVSACPAPYDPTTGLCQVVSPLQTNHGSFYLEDHYSGGGQLNTGVFTVRLQDN